jgi:hypothetical protein
MPIGERNDMLREELLEQIESLPAGTEMGIRLGGELFGIENLQRLPADGETFGMLTCSAADVRSMLDDWGYGPEQIALIMAGRWSGGLSVPEPRGVQKADQVAEPSA